MPIDRGYWTAVRDRELRRLWEAGVPAREIAELIKVPVRNVYDRANRQGYSPRKHNAVERNKRIIADYLGDNGSLRKTAARFGLSFQGVHKIVSRLKP